MKQYHELLKDVLENGYPSSDRTGTGTLSVFGRQTRYNLQDGFPLLTTKKTHFKSIVHELLWILSGDTNIKYLKDNGIKIWDEWSQFVGDYPNKTRLIDWVKIKKIEGHDYYGNFSTEGLNAERESIDDKLRNIWSKMMSRCYKKEAHNFHLYGGCGVKVHKDWHDVCRFVDDAKNLINWENKLNNWNEYELDKDYFGSGVYSKETCTWLQSSENNIYTKSCDPFEVDVNGIKSICFSYSDAEEKTGISRTTLHRWATEGKTSKSKFKHRDLEISFQKITPKEGHVLRYLFTNGNLGPVYGKQWRRWEADGRTVDQIANLVRDLKNNPNSRRLIVSAWNAADIKDMALPPCHTFFQFRVYGRKLSCQLYQRSADLFLGVPFNIASYSLLTHMIAHVLNLEVGDFIHTFGDAHIYLNHVDQVKELLKRDPEKYSLPKIELNSEIKNIDDFKYEDIKIIGYESYPSIKAPVSV